VLHKTVGELSATMTSSELSEWMAYHKVFGLPDPRLDAAQITCMIANASGNFDHPFTIEDVYPNPCKAESSPEESVRAFAAALKAGPINVVDHTAVRP
jgi:hypothetical protein